VTGIPILYIASEVIPVLSFTIKFLFKPGTEQARGVQACKVCNLSTQKAVARGWQVPSQPRIHSKILSQTNKTKHVVYLVPKGLPYSLTQTANISSSENEVRNLPTVSTLF
jgi:hypothetical protein